VPRPGRACSAYLVRAAGSAALLDLGSGAFGNLQLAIEYPRLDAVIISHLHADHFFDLVPLRYGLKHGPLFRRDRLPLWLPPGSSERVRRLCDLISSEPGTAFLDEVFIVREYDPSQALAVNELRVTFARTLHYIDAYAARVEHNGKSIVYSSDTAPSDAVVEHARGASLFLCEAGLGLAFEEGTRGHSSAAEAGEMARRAGANRLALTHYSAAYAPAQLVAAAQRTFSGPVVAVDDGLDLFV
jgi:ribonuclease BN (tRNA processing enzyme)